jgi:outer membrane protein TolC
MDIAWQEAQQKRPELLALAQAERQLRHQADATMAAELPRVDAVGELLTANPNSRYQPPVDEFKTTWAVGVQATWTVNDWPANAATRKGLTAQAGAVAAQRDAVREALRAEIVSALRGVEQAATTISAAERGVKAAEAAYRVRKDQYLAGRTKSVELTDAETDLTRARIEHIDALVTARIASVRLDYALGRIAVP